MIEDSIILSELFSGQSALRKILDEMIGGEYNPDVLPPDEHGIICVVVDPKIKGHKQEEKDD